ncbi:nuclease-related domain-containing protein [Solibacillus isronensis]|uniref:nuclease-related domain-containing protein n=1 Tax=Solibacillus isronensis TaxID=412383 RepID=UPI0020403B36|nr:NERD domain-containing protein [Solibacillus isronensis]MCM3722878.1 NERD domain-containing protein [Solibacillus isronensis]
MLVFGLLSYILVLVILLKVNTYVAIGFIIVTSLVSNAYLPQLKGYVGERRIRKILESLGEDVKIYNDLYVPKKNGEMTQIDHVLLSPNGIFVIETKNYTGWIFGSESQRNWTQTIYKKKSRFYNPVMQNKAHIKALQHYLNMDVPLHSIIVFSNAATFKFKEPFHEAHVLQTKHLKRTINQFTINEISGEQLSRISQLLHALVPDTKQQKKEIKKRHLEYVKVIAKPAKKKVIKVKAEPVTAGPVIVEPVRVSTDTACPKCGSNLVVRNGKRGSFYGCQGFPKCRFTRDL